MDVIFSSGNGMARVDDLWFDHAPKADVLGMIVRMSPVEEMIWSKAFIQERERFDGADVLHLLRETGPSLDWPRLLMRFGDHWRVLLSHLILFGFVYPDKRQNMPAWVMDELMRRIQRSRPNSTTTSATARCCHASSISTTSVGASIVTVGLRARGTDDSSRDRRDLDRRDCWNEIVLMSLGERA